MLIICDLINYDFNDSRDSNNHKPINNLLKHLFLVLFNKLLCSYKYNMAKS